MSSIKIKDKDGRVSEYVKPEHCPISSEDWAHPFGYCWGFAQNQDNGINPACEKPKPDCYER